MSLAASRARSVRPLRWTVASDRGIPLDRELDLHARELMDAPVELLELPLGIASDGVVHLEVLALDVKLHRRLPCRCLCGASNPTAD
jgi:hypothetical protein